MVFLFGTLILGAALAPILFWCSQPLSEIPGLGFLKDTDFSRFFARAILLAAVLLAFPVTRWIGIAQFRDLKIAWAWPRSWQLPAGFLSGRDRYRSVGLVRHEGRPGRIQAQATLESNPQPFVDVD